MHAVLVVLAGAPWPANHAAIAGDSIASQDVL
jgi:hypothetical protein